MIRVMMVLASVGSYFINERRAYTRYSHARHFNFESPLTFLVWLTSIVSIILTYAFSAALIPTLGGDDFLWWKLSTIISCGTLAGAIIPEVVKIFTSTESAHVREVVDVVERGRARRSNILSGLVAGNLSAYWLGMIITALMGIAYLMSTMISDDIMLAPAVFAFGLVAFGFLGMGPVTIAVDSYGPVTDNAQSVYELSTIESLPNVREEIEHDFGFIPDFELAKDNLEKNDGAGNTFKATAKPVLDRHGRGRGHDDDLFDRAGADARLAARAAGEPVDSLSAVPAGHDCRRRGDLWFSGASIQAVTTGAYRAVEFIKENIKLGDSVRNGLDRRQHSSRGDLHGIRPDRHVQYLHRRLLFDAGLRLFGALSVHRLPGVDRPVRAVPGHLHGQRRRRLGQRQESRGNRAEGQEHAAARGHASWATPSAIRSRTPRRWR